MVKSLILLSGGLDSLVSLGLEKERLNIELAITFDYGQKSLEKELDASKKICNYYGINQRVIELGWLKDITKTSLVSDKPVPINSNLDEACAKSVWVPNRNGLFLNIAGCFADSYDFDNILIGANKEEGQTFPDNTQEFINSINKAFEYSTLKHPKVIAPLINCDKNDIVKLALVNKIPLELTMSCYQSTEGHCGICESCTRLRHALEFNKAKVYINKLFG